MKKLISLITGGMLAVMPTMPFTINSETAAFSVNESNTAGIVNAPMVSNAPDSEEIPTTSTPATIKNGNLTATFYIDELSYNVYVGEQIDLNDIILNLYVEGYSPDGSFIPKPILLNYSFSIGSGKHSDCYIYYLNKVNDLSDVDTSKPGRYLINCQLKGGIKETFNIENSGCPDIPDGKYEMTMNYSNFYIPINVIDPNVTEPTSPSMATTTTSHTTAVTKESQTTATALPPVESDPIVTEPTSLNIVTTTIGCQTTAVTEVIEPIVTELTSPSISETTSPQTTAVTEEFQTVTVVLPPVKNEIRAMYTCQETYTVSVGEKFNPDDIELSVYARSAVPNQYQIDYKFTIGSGKHSDCFTYDAGGVDTSKPGTYYVRVAFLPNVKDTYVIDSSNSCNIPEGEYEMITEDIPMFSMIPVYVTESAPSVSVLGDANEDGNVNMADATAIVQHIGNKDIYGLSAQGLANADINNDGIVTGEDSIEIQKLIAKITDISAFNK